MISFSDTLSVIGIYALANIAAFLLYAIDKKGAAPCVEDFRAYPPFGCA